MFIDLKFLISKLDQVSDTLQNILVNFNLIIWFEIKRLYFMETYGRALSTKISNTEKYSLSIPCRKQCFSIFGDFHREKVT